MRAVARWGVVLGLVLVMVGCSASSRKLTRSEAPGVTATASPTRPPSATPSPSPTCTATQTPTSTPSPSPSPTETATITATLGPPPRIVASCPIMGDLGMTATHALAIVFDQAMDRDTVEAALSISPTTPHDIEWPSANHLVCHARGGWVGEQYTITLTSEIMTASGTPMGAEWQLTFGTGGRGAPVPVLMYHHILDLDADASDGQRTWTVSPSAFKEQMRYLAKNGYHTITPAQLVAYLTEGEPLPDRPIVISMDDGYKDVYESAHPILSELGLVPILFIVPEYIGYGAYLDWAQLQELVASGYAIGAHGYDHSNLRKADDQELEHQIVDSRDILAERLGVTVDAFCYPYGSYDERTLAMLAEHGYTSGYTLNRSIYQSADAVLRMNRLLVTYDTSIEAFRELLP